MIGICIGIKNRAEMLQKSVLASLDRMQNRDQIGLSIYDCGSEDELEKVLKDSWSGPLFFTSHKEQFTRSHSINNAIVQCRYENIFICDADMFLPEDFVEQFGSFVKLHRVWFPICFSLRKLKPMVIDPTYGWWRDSGLGMVGVRREDLIAVGGLGLQYVTWGREDFDFHERCKSTGYEIIRQNCYGLFHLWHPRQRWE